MVNLEKCWRRDSNPHEAFASSDFRTTMAFATLAVCGLDFPLAVACRGRPQPPSLYTFSGTPELGSGLPPPLLDVLRFPRLRLNSRGGFPAPVLKLLKSDASADSATPAAFLL